MESTERGVTSQREVLRQTGDGPCNRERLTDRVKAWDDGEWVREAALAHARKQNLKEAA